MTVSTQFRDDLRGEEKARIAEIIWGASIPTPSILLALFFSLSLPLRFRLLLSIHFARPFTSSLARPKPALRAVCVHTSADYLLLPLNYFRPAYKRDRTIKSAIG